MSEAPGAVLGPEYFIAPRRFTFDACFNMRDLGGYRLRGGGSTRWGALYRSDSLHQLTESDRQAVSQLGLRTVIDLRTRDEVDRRGVFRADLLPVDFRHLPLVDALVPPDDPTVAPPPSARGIRYADIAEEGSRSICEGFEILAQRGSLPAIFHCSAGRDRTGIFAALLLSLIGVDDDDIVADYVLTQEANEQTDRWVRANDPDLLSVWNRHPVDVRNTRPETMTSFLETIRSRHGSVRTFLECAGLTTVAIAGLREGLTDA